jgi:ribonuclease BN (tRNA processing enzyme)
VAIPIGPPVIGKSTGNFLMNSPSWQEYRRRHHTSSVELAEIANVVKPELLVLYHRSNAGGGDVDRKDVVIDETRQSYKGKVVAAHDLDVF